jgi:hypothetical protein
VGRDEVDVEIHGDGAAAPGVNAITRAACCSTWSRLDRGHGD